MKQDYLRNVSDARQWDIIQMVIKLYGHRTDIIVEMVADGYPITMDLLELLYRLRANDVIKQIMYYEDAICRKTFLTSAKMELLIRALGKDEALSLREKIIEYREQEHRKLEKEKNKEHEAELDKLYQTFGGFTPEFFRKIAAFHYLVKLAFERYDRETMISGLAKTGIANGFLLANLTPEEIVKCGLAKQFIKRLECYDFNIRIHGVQLIAQQEEGLELLLDHAYSYPSVRICLAHLARGNEDFRKTLVDHKAYQVLYLDNVLTVDEFEQWCKVEPKEAIPCYKKFQKSIFWVIKNGYLRYLWN